MLTILTNSVSNVIMLTGLVNLQELNFSYCSERIGNKMAKKEDVFYALELFHNNRPQKMLNEVNRGEMGAFAVIKLLYDADKEITSADLCSQLKISSARMAVLIKKLETKGLVVKTASQADSRAKILKLSEKGVALADKLKADMFETMGKVVDEFGIEELESFFKKLGKLKSILGESLPINLEGYND